VPALHLHPNRPARLVDHRVPPLRARRECPVCERPVRDSVLCKYCTGTLTSASARCPTSSTNWRSPPPAKPSTGPRASGGRSAETPLPYGDRASDAAKQLTDTLTLWARVITPGTYTAHTAATHLRTHIHDLARHALAEKAYDQITRARAHAYTSSTAPPTSSPPANAAPTSTTAPAAPAPSTATPTDPPSAAPTAATNGTSTAPGCSKAPATSNGPPPRSAGHPGVTAAMVRRYAHRKLIKPVGERHIGSVRVIPTYRVGTCSTCSAPRRKRRSGALLAD
jgi:hypothetical protein